MTAWVGAAERRIFAGLTAFACGDAAGVPWETKRPEEIDVQAIRRLPQRGDWPRGAVSDDTIFLLSTAQTLVSGDITPHALLRQLTADLPRARGAGRTSRAAIERFQRTGEIRAKNGVTNGAAARALPIGWATATARVDDRVRLGIELARATHGEPSAILAAVAVAAMGTFSIEGAPIDETIDHALAEAQIALSLLGVEEILLAPIECAVKDAWQPPPNGVPFTGIETVAAVVTALRAAQWTEDCIIRAVCLGGDTDTTAAIAAGIFAAWHDTPVISWYDEVPFLKQNDLAALAQHLAQGRFA